MDRREANLLLKECLKAFEEIRDNTCRTTDHVPDLVEVRMWKWSKVQAIAAAKVRELREKGVEL